MYEDDLWAHFEECIAPAVIRYQSDTQEMYVNWPELLCLAVSSCTKVRNNAYAQSLKAPSFINQCHYCLGVHILAV